MRSARECVRQGILRLYLWFRGFGGLSVRDHAGDFLLACWLAGHGKCPWILEGARRFETVKTPYGKVSMKLSYHNGERVQCTPEYEDCRAASLKTGVPLKEIQRAAVAALEALPKARSARPRAKKRATKGRR